MAESDRLTLADEHGAVIAKPPTEARLTAGARRVRGGSGVDRAGG